MLLWTIFGVSIAAMLAIDLGVFNRNRHEIGMKEAIVWSVVWITTALLFNAGVLIVKGPDAAMKFLAGYLIEKALSVDNLFVFLLIFRFFQVPAKFQHSILFWGVFGALVMRGVFIGGGIALILKFHWLIYLFGVLLIYTGIKLGVEKDKKIEPERNPVLKLFRKIFPVTSEYDERGRFFVKQDGRLFATPLLVVLLVVETTDVVFAVDSIPAIFAITLDGFIVFTSNVFAILGLRALYFALSGAMEAFHRLNVGLAAILTFVGVKMLISEFFPIPVWLSLCVILSFLVAAVAASIIWPEK